MKLPSKKKKPQLEGAVVGDVTKHTDAPKVKKQTDGLKVDSATNVATSTVESPMLTKKQRKIGIGLLVVLVVIAAGTLVVVGKNDEQKKLPTEKNGDFAALSSDDINAQKYDKNKTSLQKEINDTGGKEKAQKLAELSLLALNVNKYDEALQLAGEADKADPSYLSADINGFIYLQKGDKVQALKWYKIALERVQKSNIEGQSQLVQEYQAKIKQLEGAK